MTTIEKIDFIKKILPATQGSAQTILILLGLKPATDFTAVGLPEAEKIENALSKVNLLMYRHLPYKNSDNENVYSISVSRSQDVLSQLIKLQENPMQKGADIIHGRLMGFPETAIQAFGKEEEVLPWEEQERLTENLTGLFPYHFSKAHYGEELVAMLVWERALYTYAPEYIDQLFNKEDAENIKNRLSKI